MVCEANHDINVKPCEIRSERIQVQIQGEKPSLYCWLHKRFYLLKTQPLWLVVQQQHAVFNLLGIRESDFTVFWS